MMGGVSLCYLSESESRGRRREREMRGCVVGGAWDTKPSSEGGIITTDETACGRFEVGVVSVVTCVGASVIISVTSGRSRASLFRAEYSWRRLVSWVLRISNTHRSEYVVIPSGGIDRPNIRHSTETCSLFTKQLYSGSVISSLVSLNDSGYPSLQSPETSPGRERGSGTWRVTERCPWLR